MSSKSTYGKAPSAYKVKKAAAKPKVVGKKKVKAEKPVVKQEPENGDSKAKTWSAEDFEAAKESSTDWFDGPLNESGKRRVRVTTFGSTIGIDIREFFEGTYGDLAGKLLHSNKGMRLRPDEWESLKQHSGDIDEALAHAQAAQEGQRSE